MNTIAVTDTLSNTPENVQAMAQALGRGQALSIFRLIYSSNKGSWSAVEVAENLGITPKKAADFCRRLHDSAVLHREGPRGKIRYRKIGSLKPLASKVLKLRGNKQAIEAITTKRSLTLSGQVFLPRVPSKRSFVVRSASSKKASLRIAVLMAAPTDQIRINVGWDFKEAAKAINGSPNRDEIELKPIPAADPNDLLDSINQFKPQIIHFAGHGAADLILMDGTTVTQTEGSEVNIKMVSTLLEASSNPPLFVVLTACNTSPAAKEILSTASAVIAMSGTISDTAAALFSNRLYSAIAAGETVSNSFKQAKASLAIAQLPDANFPDLHLRSRETADLRFVN